MPTHLEAVQDELPPKSLIRKGKGETRFSAVHLNDEMHANAVYQLSLENVQRFCG